MSTQPKRGVVYVSWGNKVADELARSRRSLAEWHPELPVHEIRLPDHSSLLDKPAMFERSPFESTLFLDTDTVVLDRLDFGFEKAEKYGLACCICESPWARRFGDLHGDIVEYNTGVLFFTRAAKPVFDCWDRVGRAVDSSILFHVGGQLRRMPHNDQAGFALAIEETGFNPFVLPLNWNLRPAWQRMFAGPVKVWHDRTEVPASVQMWNERQRHAAAIIGFHQLR